MRGEEASSGTLTTAPTTIGRPLDLVAFADYGAPNGESHAVAELAARQRPRIALTGGDNTYLVALPQLLGLGRASDEFVDLEGEVRDRLTAPLAP